MDVSNAEVILTQLEALGTEQACKTYRRHGVTGTTWGVSFADLGKFQKKLKVNHPVALELWASGVHDAQILGLMVADPQQADAAVLDAWARSLTSYPITDAFSGYVAKTPLAKQKAEAWIQADHEWVESAGWNVLGSVAEDDTSLPDGYFADWLKVIERDLSGAKNRVRHAMNSTLICIGARNPALRALAEAAAGRIGKVKVDHGETGCKTPEAVAYIQRMVERREARAAKA